MKNLFQVIYCKLKTTKKQLLGKPASEINMAVKDNH